MQKRWMMGTLAVLILTLMVARATTLAQKSEGSTPLAAVAPLQQHQEVTPQRWRTAGEPPSKQAEDSSLPPLSPRRTDSSAGEDPIAKLDAFMDRNRKEADDSIKSLTREASDLRVRLQKIETALARWQNVSQSLNQDSKLSIANPQDPQLEPVDPSSPDLRPIPDSKKAAVQLPPPPSPEPALPKDSTVGLPPAGESDPPQIPTAPK